MFEYLEQPREAISYLEDIIISAAKHFPAFLSNLYSAKSKVFWKLDVGIPVGVTASCSGFSVTNMRYLSI